MYYWECVILEQSFLSERLCIVEHKKNVWSILLAATDAP